MAKTTRLIQTTNPDFTNDDHWDNLAPVNGDTIGTKVSVPGALLNRPMAGTFHVSQIDGWTFYAIHFLDGGASLGNVTVNHVDATFNQSYLALVGNLSLQAGNAWLDEDIDGTVQAAEGSSLTFAKTGVLAIDVALESAGDMYILDGCTVTAPSLASLAGTLTGEGTAELDIDGVILVTGALTVTGPIDIYGGFNADGNAVTWTNIAAGDVLTLDKAGTFALGGAAANLTVVVNADNGQTVTAGDHNSLRDWTINSGTWNGNDKTLTINRSDGGAGVVYTAGTVTTQKTDITAPIGSNWTLKTQGVANAWRNLVANGTVTLASHCYCYGLAGSAAINLGAYLLSVGWTAANAWTYTGALSAAAGSVRLSAADNLANAAAVNCGNVAVAIWTANGKKFTLASITSGELRVYGTAGETAGLVVTGLTTCAALRHGAASGTDKGDISLQGGGSCASIARATGNTATGHPLALGKNLTVSGNITLAGITPNFGSALIIAGANLTLDGASAGTVANTAAIILGNAKAVTVQNVDYTDTAKPLLCVGCTAGQGNGEGVVFLESLGARSLTGVGA